MLIRFNGNTQYKFKAMFVSIAEDISLFESTFNDQFPPARIAKLATLNEKTFMPEMVYYFVYSLKFSNYSPHRENIT